MRGALPEAEVPAAEVLSQFRAVSRYMRSVKDTHVAACAHALLAHQHYPGTQVVSLVTKNIRDFGVKGLAAIGIVVQRPDVFLLNLFQLQPEQVGDAFRAFRQSLRSDPPVPRLLQGLAKDGQTGVAARMLDAWQNGDVIL